MEWQWWQVKTPSLYAPPHPFYRNNASHFEGRSSDTESAPVYSRSGSSGSFGMRASSSSRCRRALGSRVRWSILSPTRSFG